ncbi:MAG: hypothetical protein ACYDIA_04650 [Candidatus Humimicrobiaceae bacterium]
MLQVVHGVQLSLAQVLTLTTPTDTAPGEIAANDYVVVEIGINASDGTNQITNPDTVETYQINIAGTFGDSGSVDVVIEDPTLSITSPAAAAFAGKGVLSTEQTDTAVIGNATHTDTTGIRVLDERGSGAGWSCTMTVTNLAIMKSVVTLSGSNNTVTFSGTYDGALAVQNTYKVFRVKITTGGAINI